MTRIATAALFALSLLIAGCGGTTCAHLGQTYAEGDPMPSDDCNSCYCHEGERLCSTMACEEPDDG